MMRNSPKYIALSKNQLRQLRDRGYTWAIDSSGKRKVTTKELYISNEDVEKLKEQGIFPDKET